MDWAHLHNEHIIEADEYNEYPYAGYINILETITKACADCQNVLFVGIGFGDIARTLYAQGVSITGIDFSKKMLDICKADMPEAELIHHDPEQGLPKLDSTYDAVVSLHYMKNLDFGEKIDLINDMKSALIPGGKIYIGDVAFETLQAMEACAEEFEDLWDEDDEDGAFIAKDLKSLTKLPTTFEKASFCSGVITIE